MYFTLAIFFIGILIGLFIFYMVVVFPELSISFEKLAEQSKLIDMVLNKILVRCYADRVLLFQVKNGEYFESGAPLLRLVATNEAVNTSKGVKKIKHCIKGVPFQLWGNVISFITEKKHATLSEANQYEGFSESERALKKRGMGSGVYMVVSKRTIAGYRISAILCIEWQSLNPPFDSEFALSIIAEEFLDLKKLINNYNDISVLAQKIKNIEKLQ